MSILEHDPGYFLTKELTIPLNLLLFKLVFLSYCNLNLAQEESMKDYLFKTIPLTVFCLSLSLTASAMANNGSHEAQMIVDQASHILEDFIADPNYSRMKEDLKFAKGILIIPQSLRGGFFVGGAGGTGVLLARNEQNEWSPPAFYTMGSFSLGLQIGAEASQIILLIMSNKGMDSMLSTSFKLGGDVTVAAGPIGGGIKADIADIYAYSKSKGLFGGVSFEGAVISVRENLNSNYYNRLVSPVDILILRNVDNEKSIRLRETVKRHATP